MAHLRVPVSPAGEVLSSPQVPVQDNETIAGIFLRKVIIVDSGKRAAIHAFLFPPPFLPACPVGWMFWLQNLVGTEIAVYAA